MRIRNEGLVVVGAVGAGLVTLGGIGAAASSGPAGSRAVGAVIALAAALGLVRIVTAGLELAPDGAKVRELLATHHVTRSEVLGLAVQPALGGRAQWLAVVTAGGQVLPARWTIALAMDHAWVRRAAWAAAGFGPTQPQVADRLRADGRLAADGPLPVASPDPGLTPATVSPADRDGAAGRWLGWETGFVVAAFALPAVAGAVSLLAQHVGGVSDLDEFDLPLPQHAGASLLLLLFGYLTTALVVPIALLLLARTGQPPAALGLTRAGWRRDLAGSVGLYAGVWVVNLIVVAIFLPLVDNKSLTNTATNSHVPPYYLIYAVVLSATTAINEEVIVNGYFVTRLSQRGWSPWRALALSLAVRTSYHAYYGAGVLLTVPLGYLVTRSFQKRQRLGRPILVHFVNDVVLLSIAVLTS